MNEPMHLKKKREWYKALKHLKNKETDLHKAKELLEKAENAVDDEEHRHGTLTKDYGSKKSDQEYAKEAYNKAISEFQEAERDEQNASDAFDKAKSDAATKIAKAVEPVKTAKTAKPAKPDKTAKTAKPATATAKPAKTAKTATATAKSAKPVKPAKKTSTRYYGYSNTVLPPKGSGRDFVWDTQTNAYVEYKEGMKFKQGVPPKPRKISTLTDKATRLNQKLLELRDMGVNLSPDATKFLRKMSKVDLEVEKTIFENAEKFASFHITPSDKKAAAKKVTRKKAAAKKTPAKEEAVKKAPTTKRKIAWLTKSQSQAQIQDLLKRYTRNELPTAGLIKIMANYANEKRGEKITSNEGKVIKRHIDHVLCKEDPATCKPRKARKARTGTSKTAVDIIHQIDN